MQRPPYLLRRQGQVADAHANCIENRIGNRRRHAIHWNLGNGLGAVVGGLLVGILESFGAGYLSSAYKDAIPFVLILLILFFMPRGLFGARVTDRV